MTTRAEHLDEILTGLALFDAYTGRDADGIGNLLAHTDLNAALLATLTSMELLTQIFAARLGADVTQVTDSVRRRVIRELAATGPVSR
ncbi:hypothetical protein [Nocardioides pakistanensis]